jgi:hypothetical protein
MYVSFANETAVDGNIHTTALAQIQTSCCNKVYLHVTCLGMTGTCFVYVLLAIAHRAAILGLKPCIASAQLAGLQQLNASWC